MKQTFDVVSEPVDETYLSLIDLASRKRLTALLVVREPEWISEDAKAVINQLADWTIATERASGWPGTVLHGSGSAVLRYIQLGNGAEEILKQVGSRLYAWKHPELPEDLCMLRSDRSPWLVSIAHESDAYFELEPDEIDELRQNVPGLELRDAGSTA